MFLHSLGQLETFPALPRMSVAGGKAGVPATWSDSLLVAEGVEEVGADRFCATIVPLGRA